MSIYDTVGRPWIEPPKCRVHGLASEAGRPLNGLVGKIISPGGAEGAADTRVLVMLNGVAEPKSLKLGNLHVETSQRVEFGVGVGREELGGQNGADPTRPTELFVSLVRGRDRLAAIDLPDNAVVTCGRTFGNVMAVNHCLQQLEAAGNLHGLPPIWFALTDLNVCATVNRIATGGGLPEDMPHDVLVAPLNEMHRLIRTVVDAGVAVFAIFGPHRCAQDGPTERVGTERVNSVIEHALALYPSPHPQRSGCIEVRFIGTPADPTMTPLTSRHERFIDYGPVEALAYARFTAGLGYASRLAPLVLASVDPQAFWAACLRVDDFVTTLSELSNVPAAVSAAWLTLRNGMEGVIKACRKTYIKFVAWGRDGTWSQDLTSAERHLDIAQDGAYCGMYMTKDRIEREGSSLKQRGGVRFHMLDDTKDTEMGKLFECMMMGPGSSIQDINATLKGLGHGDDPLGLAQDPMASCGACGKTDGPLRKCTACQGQVYCSDKCQRTHWPTHKKYCSRLLVKLRESRDRFEARGGSMDMKTHPGNVPATSMPASMMSEASGVGTASIFWNPGGESFITFKDYPKERRGDELDISDAEMSSRESSNDDMIKFGWLSELPAPIRFLVCCGPLQDLAVAKESLEELLTSERWQLPGADAAMQIVPSAKFTALGAEPSLDLTNSGSLLTLPRAACATPPAHPEVA